VYWYLMYFLHFCFPFIMVQVYYKLGKMSILLVLFAAAISVKLV
jgi:hypothetical protein